MWGKKFLTPEVWEKIIISKSPIPPSSTYVQWSCQLLGGGGKNEFDTSVNVIHQQMAGARKSSGGFQD